MKTQAASDGTSYQEYVLTAKGESLFPVVVALRQWGERHSFARGERHSVLIDTRTGKPVPYMAPQNNDGTELPPSSTTVRKLARSDEHTSELQSLMRISYAVFGLTKKKNKTESRQ